MMRIRSLALLLCMASVACSSTSAPNASGPPESPATPSEAVSLPSELATKMVAFMVRDRIFVAHADGSERTSIARVPHAYSGPYWSEAAQKFLVRSESKNGGFIFVVSRDGSTVTNVSRKAGSRYDAMASWSPDGKHIVFTSRPPDEDVAQIYVMGSDGSDVRQLTHGDFETQYPAWSPDAAHIAFTGYDGNFDLYRMNSDGSELTRLTDTPDQENWSTWSPDSSEIAFSVEAPEGAVIWAIKADGSGRRQITDPETTTAGEPSWSRSGPWITFNCAIPPPSRICAIRDDGSSLVELFSRAAFPYWMD